MINHHGTLLPSITWGLTIMIVCAVIGIALTGFFVRKAKTWKPKYRWSDRMEIWMGLGMAGVTTLVLIIAGLAGFYPYKGDYHRLQPVTGTVTAVDSRFFAASQYVVVTYDTGLTVRCDDSRCATVRPGQQLRLLCTKEHQFGSPLASDGWGCRWGQQ